MNKTDPETFAAIVVLGAIGLAGVFVSVPDGSALLVTAVVSGLTGWIARGTPAPPKPPETALRRPPLIAPGELDIPPPP